MGLEQSRADVEELLVGKAASSLRTEEEWSGAQDVVMRWFADVKVAESTDTFQAAFQDSRMTMRAILDDRQTGYWQQKVPIRGADTDAGVRDLKSMYGVAGIKERMVASNFQAQGKLERAKYEKGLFDMSAALLNPRISLKIGGGADIAPAPVQHTGKGPPPPPPPKAGGANQIYRTTGDTTYVFMPVSPERDMLIFHVLNLASKVTASPGFRRFAQYMRSRLTRIKFAFEGDAGAKFLDFAPAGEQLPKFRYGFGKIMTPTASYEEIADRKLKATEYKTILRSGKRNEIILAYRQHGTLADQPSTFPVFAKGVFAPNRAQTNEPLHKGYEVVGDDLRPMGFILTLGGVMRAGRAADLGGTTELFPISLVDAKPQ